MIQKLDHVTAASETQGRGPLALAAFSLWLD